MRVALFPADLAGCGWYRFLFPANALAGDANVEISIRQSIGKVRYRPGLALRLAEEPDYDVAVLQRPFNRLLAAAIPLLKSHGVAVVVDMDDDVSNLPPGHGAFMQLHPRASEEHNWRNAELACLVADLVTVSTPPLLRRYASHGRGAVLRNCVPEEYLDVTSALKPLARKSHLTVGWSGALTVHPGDLEVCRMGIARGLGDAHFRAVAPERASGLARDEVHRRLQIPEAQRDVAPWAELRSDYPAFVAGFDVGIAPLANNGFNQAKSALRGLEYAALGVPFIASALPEYRRLEALGVGVLAAKPRDWERELRRLVGSAELRAETAARARETISGLTYEANAHLWPEAWERALNIRRGALVASA